MAGSVAVSAKPWWNPSREVSGEPRLRRRHPEVGRACEAEAAADRGTLHRRDNRQLGREEPDGLAVELTRTAGRAAAAAEVGARAEVLAARAEHDHAHVTLGGERVVQVRDTTYHRDVEEVVRRSAQLHG